MTVRHIVLAAAAILVVGLGVKLFYEVRASPTIEAPSEPPVATSHPTSPTSPARPHARQPVRTDRGATPAPAEAAPPASPRNVGQEMLEANKAYDRQDYDEAKELANRILSDDPANVRMRRILVSTACMQGDAPEAQKQFDLLPTSGDARQVMRVRCKREGIVFTETATGSAFQPSRTP